MELIRAKDLVLGYEGKPVVSGLSFDVELGDYLCIVGENGSGKTTLMKTLLGLMEPMEGSIEFGMGLKKNEIGYLPQQSDHQKDFPATVEEIVISGCQGKHGFISFYNDKDRADAGENMELLDIADLAKKSYRDLSGGQQQRVLLARALCATQKILLLDEPVTGLDPKVTRDMYGIIKELNDEGITIIMISHDLEAATRYASRILYLGENVFFGKTSEFLADPPEDAFIRAEGRGQK